MLFASLVSTVAHAEPNPSFYLVNRSTVAITRVFASPANRPNWGVDRLDAPLAPGANAAIRLPADGECVYDLRVVYATGRSEERRGLDMCRIDNLSFSGGKSAAMPETRRSAGRFVRAARYSGGPEPLKFVFESRNRNRSIEAVTGPG